jgi:signal transduction histidine kinase
MNGWERLVSTVGGERIITSLGGLYVALASVLLVNLLMADAVLVEFVGRLSIVSILGGVLLYGRYRMAETDIHPDAYPVIVKYTLGGTGVMLSVLVLIELISPSGVDNPLFTVPLASSLGSVGGLGAGIHDARAKTRERELEETVRRLEASNERLEQFAYAASHDLQEPLRMVSSYLQLLERRYADDLDEDAEEYIEFAVTGADRMRAMIENLLKYSRVTTRGDPLEPTDTEAVLKDVLDNLHLQIEETDAVITVDELPTVNADADQLAQLFQNLLSNALKYSGDEPPKIRITAERTGDDWQFAVTDEGIGIDPEYHDRIFTVFEQLRIDEDDKGEGGIGLALCERIVERHGGEIWVESERGTETTFYFTLPASPEGQPTTPAEPPSPDQRRPVSDQ